MQYRRQLVVIGMTAAVLLFGVLTAAGNARAQTTNISPVFDSFDTNDVSTWSSGIAPDGRYDWDGTLAECFSGACIKNDTFNTIKGMWKQGFPTIAGSFVIYERRVNYTSQYDIGVCQSSNSCNSMDWINMHITPPLDAAWHTLLFAYKQGDDGIEQVCHLVDDTDLNDCSWADNGNSLPNGTVWDSVFMKQNAGIPSGGGVWFDELGSGSVLNWNAITTPPPFTLGTSTSLIAASSSLWGSISLASSSLSCSTGNVFSDALCSAGAFLFLPAPSTLEEYANLPVQETTHWPFSWIAQVQQTFNSATSTSGRMPAYSLDLTSAASTTFASTTMPNFMPSFTFFSSTTVMTYLPQSDWDALQSLLAAALWLGVVFDIAFTLRNRMHRI